MVHLTDIQRRDAEALQHVIHQNPEARVEALGHEWAVWTSLKNRAASFCITITNLFFNCMDSLLSYLEGILADNEEAPHFARDAIEAPELPGQNLPAILEAAPTPPPSIEPFHPVTPLTMESALLFGLCQLKIVRELSCPISSSSQENASVRQERERGEKFRSLLRTMHDTIKNSHTIPAAPLDATVQNEFNEFCQTWQRKNIGKPLHTEHLFLEFFLQSLFLSPMHYQKHYTLEDSQTHYAHFSEDNNPIKDVVSQSILLNVPNGADTVTNVAQLFREPYPDDFVPPPPPDPSVIENPKDPKPPVALDGSVYSFNFPELPDMLPCVINRYDEGAAANVMPSYHITKTATYGKKHIEQRYRLKAIIAAANAPNQYVLYKPGLLGFSFVKYDSDGTIYNCTRQDQRDISQKSLVFLYEKELRHISCSGKEAEIEYLHSDD